MPGELTAGAVEKAVTGWRIELGDATVLTDARTLADYQMNISEFKPRDLLAVLQPSSLEDVRRLIVVARSTGVPVHPISSGRSWGFGSALPAYGPVALVDLRRMNRILDVNSRFRYAVIEPGVTQEQLSTHLAASGGTLKLNVTGAGLETSIVGNVLDRGGGNLGPRADDLLGMEVALGNGEVVRTGLWHLREDGDAIHYYPPGIGPDLRGLFMQSNFGIVTKMALRLHPFAPFTDLTVRAEDANFPEIIDVLRLAREDGVITGFMRISDGTDPNIRYFPSGESAAWCVQITLRGTPMMRAEARREITRRLGGLTDRIDAFDTEYDDLQTRTGQERVLLEARLGLMNGVPSNRTLESIARMAGKSFSGRSADLDRDRDLPGFLCVNVTLPFTGEHVAACAAVVRAATAEAGVATSQLFEVAGPAVLFGLFAFYFDRHDGKEVARAHAFKNELLRRLEATGIYPVRLDVDSIGAFIERTADSYWRSVSAIKKALDPQGIIAGRYALAEREETL
jgi:4-cresol dehydrogenase (hydroxylating)